jgi:ABC-2 type transport system permease protein
MKNAAKCFRLLGSLASFTLAREMAFRGNFLVKVSVEVIWLGIMLAFYETVFGRTKFLAGWSKDEFYFFVGCFFALNGLIEMLFLENCNDFAELVRTGDLDFLLLRPIDEQFLITCRKVDWATAPNVLMGAVVMGLALGRLHWAFDPVRVLAFLATFACGTAIAYSFMLVLTAFSVWLVRNQSLMEMWWLFSSLARYPKEIFLGSRAEPLGFVFTFILPILLVANVPANAMVRSLDWPMVGFTLTATAVLLWASRKFFQHALRSYRSASS